MSDQPNGDQHPPMVGIMVITSVLCLAAIAPFWGFRVALLVSVALDGLLAGIWWLGKGK
jgi:hypothetical protein